MTVLLVSGIMALEAPSTEPETEVSGDPLVATENQGRREPSTEPETEVSGDQPVTHYIVQLKNAFNGAGDRSLR